jgi:hypothetical protein
MRLSVIARFILAGLFLAAPVAACGGGDSKASTGGAGSSADTAYVTGLCQSFAAFSDSIEKSFSGPTPSDIGDAFAQLFKAMVQPTQQFSDAFGKLQPPSDLADWHKNTATQLAAAAKALKSGKFDDPALQGLSNSPIPDMPDAPRQRLEAIATKTDACKKANPFDTSLAGGSTGSGSATPALKDAAAGSWTGKFGSLVFNSDGTAKFELMNCGTESPSNAPFGVVDTCSPDTYAGTISVGSYQYTFKDGAAAGTVLQAYIDKDKRLHIGVGTVAPFGPGQKGTVESFAGGVLKVDGDKCTKQSFASSKDSKDAHCTWKKQEGKDVLEFDDDFGGRDQLVILGDEGLAVSPAIYVAAFDRLK